MTIGTKKTAQEEKVSRLYAENHLLAAQDNRESNAVLQNEARKKNKQAVNAEKTLTKLQIECGKNRIILNAGLSRTLNAETITEITEKVRQVPENLRILWNLASRQMKVLDSEYSDIPYYDIVKKGIKFNIIADKSSTFQKSYRTIFHELGHLIDHWLGKQVYFHSPYYKNGLFGNMLKKEAEDYVNATLVRLKREVVAMGKSAKSLTEEDAYKAISDELKRNTAQNLRDISDIWHGATNKKVEAGWGHERKGYWTENGGINLSKEAFAHMFQATINNCESLEQIKKYFPESYKIFEEMIEDSIETLIKAV